MSIIKEALDDIVDRLGFGLPDEIKEVIHQWLRRAYVFGALDERRKQERILVENIGLKKQVASQLREINTYRRILSTHDLL